MLLWPTPRDRKIKTEQRRRRQGSTQSSPPTLPREPTGPSRRFAGREGTDPAVQLADQRVVAAAGGDAGVARSPTTRGTDRTACSQKRQAAREVRPVSEANLVPGSSGSGGLPKPHQAHPGFLSGAIHEQQNSEAGQENLVNTLFSRDSEPPRHEIAGRRPNSPRAGGAPEAAPNIAPAIISGPGEGEAGSVS